MPSDNLPYRFQDDVEIVIRWHTAITLSKHTCSIYGHIYPPPLFFNKKPYFLSNGIGSKFHNLTSERCHLNFFLLYGNMGPILGCEPLIQVPRISQFGSGLHEHHNHAFNFVPHKCGRRKDFLKMVFFLHIWPSPWGPGWLSHEL